MIRQMLLAASLLACACAARAEDAPLFPARPPAATVAASQTYTPDYFARFAPRNAADMLTQVPGFIIHAAGNARGLGQASANVLINGERMPGKSEDALAQLARVPAANVLRIEIVDAATLSLPGLSGQVANVVVASAGITGQFSWRGEMRPHYADPMFSRFEVSVSGRTGALDYTLGISNQGASRGAAGGPTVILAPDGSAIEHRRGILISNWDQPKATAALKLDGPGSSVGNLNLSYRRTYGRMRLDEVRIRPGEPDRQRDFTHRERGHDWEIGGDFEFAAGPGRIKLIGLDRFSRTPFRQANLIAAADGSGAMGDRYAQAATSHEKIARAEYGWKLWGAGWQLSAEAAFNRLDNSADLFTLDPATGLFGEVPLPGADGGVRESRYETMLSINRTLAPGLSFQLAGGAEFSRLAQTPGHAVAQSGGQAAPRRFRRPKGSLLLAWTPRKGSDVSATLSRKVGQLDFGDFLARVFLGDGNANGGNNRLVPEQSWEAELEIKQDMKRWGTASLRLYDHRIEDIVDFVPLPGGGELRGNIDHARRMGVEFSGTLLLDAIGFTGAKFDARFQFERSRLRDPLTLRSRPIGNTEYRLIDTELRHDIPGSHWAWGINFSHYRYNNHYRPSETGLEWEGPHWLGVQLEHKAVLGLTLTARAGNLLNARSRLDRKVYAGPRTTSPLLFIERRNRLIGPILSIAAKGNF